MRESFLNFATSLLSGTTLTTGGTSFSITATTGALFPTANFVVTVDTEIMLITSRTTDTFTIGVRAYDGSTVASHSSGATVQLTMAAYTLNHAWQNIADTYIPEVPPVQNVLSATGVPNGSASASDTEFESAGSWTIYPSPSGGSLCTIGSTMRSHLAFLRAIGDNTLYSVYAAFTYGSAFTMSTKLCEGINIAQVYTQNVQSHFFVSDQSNPTSSADSGNRFRVDVVTSAATASNQVADTNRYVRAYVDVSGAGSQVGPSLVVSAALPLYLRITYDGSGNWHAYVGDGFCYTWLASYAGLSFTPASMGYQFVSGNNSGTSTSHWAVSDFIRAILGSVSNPFGV